MRSYALLRDRHPNIHRPHAASTAYAPGQICAAYTMPTGMQAKPLTIVIGELGGKFYPGDLKKWAAKSGLPTPKVQVHLLPGASDAAGDADAEVALDWQMAATYLSYITGLAANILLIYGPNSGPAFGQVMAYANTLTDVGAGSWSWGDSENNFAAADLASIDAQAQAAKFPWCAASGDNDADDGENAPTVDAPACIPSIIGCGGTSRPPSGGAETVWNDGGGEGTGGGFSKLYSRPTWQPANKQGHGRMVPDVAMVADPNTGYETVVNGQWQVIGGTSAVAPSMAGFLCAVNGVRLANGLPLLGSMNAALWANPTCFLDITSGNNGHYRASAGPDPCSGLGRPLAALFASLTEATPTVKPAAVADINFPAILAELEAVLTIVRGNPAIMAMLDTWIASLPLSPAEIAILQGLLTGTPAT